MNYKLPDIDLSKFTPILLGERKRWATATSVNFVTDKLILIASLLGKKIYLFDVENLKIINEVNTINYPDLMDYKDGLIVIAERNDKGKVGNIGFFELSNNKIKHKKNIDLIDYNELHGVRIINENQIIFTDKSRNRGVHIFNHKINEIKSFNEFKFLPCDVFLFDDKILVLTTETKPNNNGNRFYKPKLSHIHLYEFPSFTELSKISFGGQVDCISYENGKGFVTIQSNDSLFHFEIVGNELFGLGEIKKEFSFPHGVAFKNGVVCVTNYGTNSIDILKYEELL